VFVITLTAPQIVIDGHERHREALADGARGKASSSTKTMVIKRYGTHTNTHTHTHTHTHTRVLMCTLVNEICNVSDISATVKCPCGQLNVLADLTCHRAFMQRGTILEYHQGANRHVTHKQLTVTSIEIKAIFLTEYAWPGPYQLNGLASWSPRLEHPE